MSLALRDPGFLFIPDTDWPADNPVLQDDLRATVGSIVRARPDEPLDAGCRAVRRALLAPVDGDGRTEPRLHALGFPGLDAWRRFLEASPTIQIVPVDLLSSEDPEPLFRLSGACQRTVSVDGALWVKTELPWRPGNPIVPMALPPGARSVQRVIWPAPWDAFLPGIAPLEALVEWARLAYVWQLIARGRGTEALAAAEEMLAVRSATATAPSTEGYWRLLEMHEGEQALLFEAEAAVGVSAGSAGKLFRSSKFVAFARRPVRVTVFLGILGWVWYSLARELREGRIPRRCQRCGQFLAASARAGTRYCTHRSNPDCWRARRTEGTARRRARRRAP